MQGTNDNSARAIEIASGIKNKRLCDPDYVRHGANSAVESRATDNKRT